MLASFAAVSPLFRPPEEYRQASRSTAVFLDRLAERIRQAPAGTRIDAGPYPRLTIGAGGRQVPTLVSHSLSGWARIVFPERRVVFVDRGDPVAEPMPPEAVVVALGGGIHKKTVPD